MRVAVVEELPHTPNCKGNPISLYLCNIRARPIPKKTRPPKTPSASENTDSMFFKGELPKGMPQRRKCTKKRPGCASKCMPFEKIMLGMIFGRWQSQMVFDNRDVEVIQSVDHAIFPACSGIY